MTSNGQPTSFEVRILRQDAPGAPSRWERHRVAYEPDMNVISVLQKIAMQATTVEGRKVAPVAWEANCLEEVCGACSMVINGRVRQSCSCLVDTEAPNAGDTITLEPMGKFPVVRDLLVDRARLFHSLTRVKAWVPIDGTYDLGAGPGEIPERQQVRYELSECMSCGCCLEACPQYTIEGSPAEWDRSFIGPHAISQARLFNEHETGKVLKSDRLEVLMGQGGVSDCGNAQNCAKACPKSIPLTESIAAIGRSATVESIKQFFGGKR